MAKLTLWIDVDALRVLLLVVLLDAEDLAVPVLVLQDVSVLLALQPRVLQVEKHGFAHLVVQQLFHLLEGFQVSEVLVRRRRTLRHVFVRLPNGKFEIRRAHVCVVRVFWSALKFVGLVAASLVALRSVVVSVLFLVELKLNLDVVTQVSGVSFVLLGLHQRLMVGCEVFFN